MRRGRSEKDQIPETIRRLREFQSLNRGSISNAADSDGWTALHLASFLTFPSASKCVEYLLQCGVDHSIKNSDGQTALHLAAANGSEKIVRLLISYGSPVEWTPHAYGINSWFFSRELLCSFANLDCQVDVSTDAGETPLQFAARSRNPTRRFVSH